MSLLIFIINYIIEQKTSGGASLEWSNMVISVAVITELNFPSGGNYNMVFSNLLVSCVKNLQFSHSVFFEGLSFIFCDNKLVLIYFSKPDSMLKNKSNSIAYQFLREGCTTNGWRATYMSTHLNVVDLVTKSLLFRVYRH